MMMKKEINNLLNKLDVNDDSFLIWMLKTKLGMFDVYYNKEHSVTDSELNSATNGLKTILTNYSYSLLNDHTYYSKLRKIIDNNNCDDCKLGIPVIHDYGEYKNQDKSNKTCISCRSKFYILCDLSNEFDANMRKAINDVINGEKDLMLLRALSNKLGKKVRKLQGKHY